MNFTNTADKRIGFLYYDLVSGEVSESVVVRAVAEAGATLKSTTSASAKLKAREHGTMDTFVDLADGINLSAYTPGDPVDFDFICEATEDLTGLNRAALFIGVVNSGAAAWGA
jgi:hypothetical protein